jgi:hypothetical protein
VAGLRRRYRGRTVQRLHGNPRRQARRAPGGILCWAAGAVLQRLQLGHPELQLLLVRCGGAGAPLAADAAAAGVGRPPHGAPPSRPGSRNRLPRLHPAPEATIVSIGDNPLQMMRFTAAPEG